jgi:hypothetical protein
MQLYTLVEAEKPCAAKRVAASYKIIARRSSACNLGALFLATVDIA